MAYSQFSHILPVLFVVIVATLTSQTYSSVISVTSTDRDHAASQNNIETSSLKSPESEQSDDQADIVDCPRDFFFSGAERVCKPCSACPVNRIIRRPCGAYADTLCGPFVEFDKFQQAPVRREQEEGGEGDKHEGKHHKRGHHHKKGHHHAHHETGLPAEEMDPDAEADLTSQTLEQARSQWRTLSLALIAVLSVICCIVVVVGIYVFVVCRRSREQKHLLREPVYLPTYQDVESEPRYVETYFTSSRDRLRSPRHLPVYQHVYTGGDVTPEFPSLVTSSTTQLTKESTKEKEEEDEGDQYIYFNLPLVNHSDV